jgi:hydrogenase maturation protease
MADDCPKKTAPQTLVLGLGNLIMTDDGIGVRVVQLLQNRYSFPAGVAVIDGGTLGLDLLPKLEGIERLLVVDAIETGEPPGTVVRLAGDQIPIAMATKLSPHQMGLKDLLSVAALMGCAPQEMVLWGVQPEAIEIGTELSETVAAQLETLAESVIRELANWGLQVVAC